ncbi:MAG: TspO/MBR family protein [Candidatus Micrarchaeia archaeon]
MKWKLLIAAVLICELAGVIGSVFTFSSIPTWYATLVKPDFAPPNWLFGPVWITLYAMMGVSAYLVYETGKRESLKIFGLQLALNASWSIVFFGLRSISGGLLVILLLWLAIAWTILSFLKVSKTAAYLLIPYISWVSFASVLNYFIFMLN